MSEPVLPGSALSVDDVVAQLSNHYRLYRGSEGLDGHLWVASAVGWPHLVPTLCLTTIGRRTGKPRTRTLVYGIVDGSVIVVASKGGMDSDPDWYLNLLEQPNVKLQIGPQRLDATARVAEPTERPQFWEHMTRIFPPINSYQVHTEREIPLVVLEPDLSTLEARSA